MIDLKKQEEYKKKLSEEQYDICFLKGTEPPGSGRYLHNKEAGIYECVACGLPLFSSETKFESGTGWPSFWDRVNKENITLEEDMSLGMRRMEIRCSRCGAHLGHVFDDGPEPSGKRYCINSLTLNFVPKK